MTDSPPTQEIDADIRALLTECPTAGLATVGPDGSPHAANVWFASDDKLNLYWVSSPRARHSTDLVALARMAVTVYPPIAEPDDIHGLQLRGHAAAIAHDTEAWDHAFNLYAQRFAFVNQRPSYRETVLARTFYRFTPTWLRLLDNRRGFAWKHERDL